MDPLRQAAALLSETSNGADVGPLLAFFGFENVALPLDDTTAGELCLMDWITDARVARGRGSLRALILECDKQITTQELIRHSAVRLASKTPHLLWTVIVLNRAQNEIGIACWETGGRGPRVVALIASRQRILDSDSETLCALAAASSDSDLLTHSRWLELLGREAITRRFFRALRGVVDDLSTSLSPGASAAERKELALLCVSRLLFLSFVETRGWLNGDFDFLANAFARSMAHGGCYHRRVLQPLFFGTLNTRFSARAPRAREFGRVPFLNGGLFTRSNLETRFKASFFPDDAIGEVFSRLLTSFRFSPREDSNTWSETAVDPEILGKAFEALMASGDRKTSGAFYTPQRLVEHVTESALVAALASETDKAALERLLSTGELPNPEIRDALLTKLGALRLLDPACGSGAFLVHALERLSELRLRLGEVTTSATIRRKVLSASIFGVDINPMAVWLCQLRLWLSIVTESAATDPMDVRPLPNLDRQIRVGDSLAGGSFAPERGAIQGSKLATLRALYMRAVGQRKRALARELDRQERSEAIATINRLRSRLHCERRELVLVARCKDLFGERLPPTSGTLEKIRGLRLEERNAAARQRRLRSGAALPFAFNVHFADVATAGGFDVVVGNPPWVRIHNISPGSRQILRREFRTFRDGGWHEGARLSGSGKAFANQPDLAAFFLERSTQLLREDGALALLLPAKLWRSLSGGGARRLVQDSLEIVALEDLTEAKSGFDAAVYPSLLVARRKIQSTERSAPALAAAVFRRGSALQWQLPCERLALDESPASPWLILPREVRQSFDALASAGVQLSESRFGRPLLGVKTGCNDAFVVCLESSSESVGQVRSSNRAGEVEAELLRPVVRGETISSWKFAANSDRILWTHSGASALKKLPPKSAQWLGHWRSTLERRSDGHGSPRWWSLFRTDGAACDCPRVVWGDFGKSPRALVLEAGENVVPLNTCYVLRCMAYEDALALAALLNGPLSAAWLNTLAEPARGGYRRYLGWTMSLLPLPRDWIAARDGLADLGAGGRAGNPPTQHDLLSGALRAFRIRKSSVEALLTWNHRS